MAVATPRKADDLIIVDADIHVNDTPGKLAPYMALPWRKSLEALSGSQRYLDVPGFAPSLKLDPPIPGGHAGRSVHTVAEMRQELDDLGIDLGLIFPDNLLLFAVLPNIEYATELSHAYNRWLVNEWLSGDHGLYGAILACPQNPTDSAQEIARVAKERNVAAIYLPTAGVHPLWGDRRYDPIFAAAQEADLPVLLHSVTVITPQFPYQLDQFENHWARQMLSHAFAMQANLVSLMHTGVPARFPHLKVGFTEAGIAWVPYMMWRMDKYYNEYRRMVPFLEKRPSEYLRERMWFATQPIEEPDDPRDLVTAITLYDPEGTRTIYASDWPHHDFDHPKGILKLPMPAEMKRRIMGENALELFKLPVPVRKES